MILLTTVNDSITLVTTTSDDIHYCVSFVDISSSAFTPGSSQGIVTTATTTTIAASPASGVNRQIKYISLFNADGSTNTITLNKKVSSTEHKLITQQLLSGNTLEYTDGVGFKLYPDPSAVTDGDKGDITVSSTGTVWTIDNDAVTYAKIQNVSATDKLLGRSTSGAGDVEEIACTSAGRALIDDADASAQRTTLGLGTLATQSGTFSGTSSGTNTGDQTSIVGISGTKAQFDTACSDGNFLYTGDITQYTDELAQDAVGAMVDSSLVYVDGTPLLQRAALTGDITASAGSNATLIATPGSVTVANDDKVLIKDTSASDVLKYVSTQSIRDLVPGSGTLTSAQLATSLTDETGSGASVFATSPTLVTPLLGTPTSGVLTNCTGLPVAGGGTGVSSVTSAPTASSFAGWDANSNLSANNFLEGYTSTATAAGTTTLTVSSTRNRIFTGSTTQTCVLPVVSTLALGTIFRIVNLSSGVVTVQSSGANTIQAMQANSTLILVSNATSGTGASVWHVMEYTSAASGQTGSGSIVRATSPSLVTPTLGVASATSINFGGSALSTYVQNTSFLVTISFTTPGDLSVSYIARDGIYTRIGTTYQFQLLIGFTPTYTTAAGSLRINGMPFTATSFSNVPIAALTSAVTYPAGCTNVHARILYGTTSLDLVGNGSGVATTNFGTTEFVSGVAYVLTLCGVGLI